MRRKAIIELRKQLPEQQAQAMPSMRSMVSLDEQLQQAAQLSQQFGAGADVVSSQR